MPTLARLARPLLDYVLPPRCPGCGGIVDRDHRFCARCWAQLDFLTGTGCQLCAIPLGAHDGLICGPCLADPPLHDGVCAAVAYGDVARTVVLSLKYARRPGLAKTIAALLVARLPADRDALLVPVPLHRWRLWSRGFNQSQAIAAALAARTGLVCDPGVLVRTRATPSMRGLDPAERRRSVRKAFAVRRTLAGQTVFLVDDVFTTGATASACARVLKRAGAARVVVLCWARVLPAD